MYPGFSSNSCFLHACKPYTTVSSDDTVVYDASKSVCLKPISKLSNRKRQSNKKLLKVKKGQTSQFGHRYQALYINDKKKDFSPTCNMETIIPCLVPTAFPL